MKKTRAFVLFIVLLQGLFVFPAGQSFGSAAHAEDDIFPGSLVPFVSILPDTAQEELAKQTGGTILGEFLDFDSSWMDVDCHVMIEYHDGLIQTVIINGRESSDSASGARSAADIENDAIRFYGDHLSRIDGFRGVLIDNGTYNGVLSLAETTVFYMILTRKEQKQPFNIDRFQSHDKHYYKTIRDEAADRISIQTDFAEAREKTGQYYELYYSSSQTDKSVQYMTLVYPSVLVLHPGKSNESAIFRIVIEYIGNKRLDVNSCVINVGGELFTFTGLEDHKVSILDGGAVKETIVLVLDRDSQILLDTWRSVTGTVDISLQGNSGTSDLVVSSAGRMDISDCYQLYLEASGADFSFSHGTPMETTAARVQKGTGKESVYQEALQLENEGRFETALLRYKTISGYKDSEERIKTCRIRMIRSSMDLGRYQSAMEELEQFAGEDWAADLYRLCEFRTAANLNATSSGTFWFQCGSKGPYRLIASDGTVLADGVEGKNLNACDDSGQLFVSAAFDKCSKMTAGHVVITRGNRQFLSDTQGNETELPGKLQYCFPLTDTLISFQDSKGNYGAADSNGKTIIKASWKHLSGSDCGLLEVTDSKNRAGIIDTKGKTVLAPGKYDLCRILGENLIYVAKYDKKTDTYKGGLVNRKGKELAKPGQYEGTIAAQYGDRIILKKDGFYGVLDPQLNTVLPFIYQSVTGSADGSAFALKSGDSWEIYSKTGELLIGNIAADTVYIPSSAQNCFAARDQNRNYIIWDYEGNTLY